MLFFCPVCDQVVEILGVTRALSFRCAPCEAELEPCDLGLDPLHGERVRPDQVAS